MDIDGPQNRAKRRMESVLRHLAKSQKGEHNHSVPTDTKSCAFKSSCAGAVNPASDIEDFGGSFITRKHSADYGDDSADLFSAKHFSATQKPLLEASTLPSECYTSTRWFEREMERVFLPSWTLLGRTDEMEEPGEYLAIDTVWGGPIAVCRGEDRKLYAFANVCCHRGAKVLPGQLGKGSSFGLVCPYHAWTYEYNGKLKFAPGMRETKNFNKSDFRLEPVRCAVFHGFVFVCLDKDSPPLEETLGDLPSKLGPWFGKDGSAKDMVCAGRREYVVDCNWKFLMENTCETYHTSVVHRSSLGPMDATPMEPHVGSWDAVRVPSARSIVPLPSDFKDVAHPLPPFTDSTAFVNFFPALQINVTWDCLWWMRMIPEGVHRTKILMGFCFPRPTIKLPRFPGVFKEYLKRWHMAVSEDNGISMNQERGVRSMFRKPGRYCQLEFGTHNFNNWLVSHMIDGALRWDPGQRVHVASKGGKMWSNSDTQLLKIVKEAATAAESAQKKNPSE